MCIPYRLLGIYHATKVQAVVAFLTKNAQRTGRRAKHEKINWEGVCNQVLEFYEKSQQREISNSKRFLLDDEFELEMGFKFEDGADRRYVRGEYKGKEGVYILKLGVEMQDEHVKGAALSHKYDEEETMDNEKKAVFEDLKRSLFQDLCKGTSSSTPPAPSKPKAEKPEAAVEASTPSKANAIDVSCDPPTPPQGAKRAAAKKAAAEAKPKAKTKAKAKGRPPKSILAETSHLCDSFLSSDPDSKLWWGSECKTQLGNIKDLRKQFEQRIESATEPEIIATLEPSHKKIRVLALLLEAHQKSGF